MGKAVMEAEKLTKIDENVWVADRIAKIGFIRFPQRMTVIRLADGSLWVHSPVPLTPSLKRELDELGPVRQVVAPNLFHHLFIRPMQEAYPEARFYAAPGLDKKRANFSFAGVLTGEAPLEWRGQIDQLVLGGAPKVGEVAFFHRASRTLIVTDVVFNLRHVAHAPSRFFYKLYGVYRKFGPSRLVKMVVKDRKSFGESFRRMLEWDFKRVVMAHGEVLEDQAKETFQKSFDWI